MRRNVRVVHVPDGTVVGKALLEADNTIVMVSFSPVYDTIYGPAVSDYHYITHVSDDPYVRMVKKSNEPPVVAQDSPEDILGDAARMLRDKLQWNQESAESAISTLVLNGFVIRKVSRGVSPNPG